MMTDRRQVGPSRLLRACKRIIILLSVGGGLGLMLFVVVHGEHGYLALKRSIAEEQRRIEAVKTGEQRNQQLQEEIQRLKEDPRLIEKIAREELGLTSPKDIVIKFLEPAPPASDKKNESGR